MIEKEMFNEFKLALEHLRKRDDGDNTQIIERCLVIIGGIIEGKEIKENYSLIQRIVNDSLPWDDEFLSKYHDIQRQLRQAKFLDSKSHVR